MKWTELTSNMNTWQPEANETIQGRLSEIKTDVGPNHSNVYVVENEHGETDIWGSTVLDQEIPKLDVGTYIKIQYLGEKTNPSTGRTYKAFKVWKGEADE